MPGYDPAQQALYAPPMSPWIASGTVALIANRVCGMRFVAPRAATIKKVSFALTTSAGADDQIDIGIYNAAGTTLLGSIGPTSGLLLGAPVVKVASFLTPVPLVAGSVYYAAFGTPATFGGSAGQVLAPSNGASVNLFRMFGAALPIIETFADTPKLGVPLPASTTASGGPGVQAPIICMLEN